MRTLGLFSYKTLFDTFHALPSDAFKVLSGANREILERHYGLQGKPKTTIKDLASYFGIKEQHIVQHHRRALQTLLKHG